MSQDNGTTWVLPPYHFSDKRCIFRSHNDFIRHKTLHKWIVYLAHTIHSVHGLWLPNTLLILHQKRKNHNWRFIFSTVQEQSSVNKNIMILNYFSWHPKTFSHINVYGFKRITKRKTLYPLIYYIISMWEFIHPRSEPNYNYETRQIENGGL